MTSSIDILSADGQLKAWGRLPEHCLKGGGRSTPAQHLQIAGCRSFLRTTSAPLLNAALKSFGLAKPAADRAPPLSTFARSLLRLLAALCLAEAGRPFES